MDSVTQATLGSAVGMAVMGRSTPLWKSALVGALCGTLPDLDFLIDYGDPIRNMTNHRGFSHSLIYLSVLAPVLAWFPARWVRGRQNERVGYGRWWLAIWLVLVSHVLLDALTIYGTQLLLPFTDHPFGVGSIFIIDPLYSLPLLLGIGLSLWRGTLRWNGLGLVLSSLYLVWGLVVQQQVQTLAERWLNDQGWKVERMIALPTTLNSAVWRLLVITPDAYLEGFYALADRGRPIDFRAYPRGEDLYRRLNDNWGVSRMAHFTKGYFAVTENAGEVKITDLRMGQEPYYSFNFVVAERKQGRLVPTDYRLEMEWPPLVANFHWLLQRAQGKSLPPPWLGDKNLKPDNELL